jgi:hypothetical protein
MMDELRRRLSAVRDIPEPHAQRLSVVVIIVCVVLTIYWAVNLPDPGKAVALLGAAAVFLALRGEIGTIRPIEKMLWSIIVFGLLLIEIRALDKDRATNQSEQANIRNEENKRFTGLVTRLEANIDQITGGKSICYIDIRGDARVPGKLVVFLLLNPA